MSQFTRQFYGREIDFGLNSTSTIEPVKVTLPNPGNINSGLAALPIRGSNHPDQTTYPGMVLERIRLRAWMNRETALYDLIYRRQLTGYSGGPRPISRTIVFQRTILLPLWYSIPLVPSGLHWYENKVSFERASIIRVEARFRTETVTVIQNAMAANIGRYYDINGLTYVFDGGNATSDGIGFTRVEYHLRTSAPIQAIPALSSFGNALAVPLLPSLHEYSSVAGNPPVVSIVAPVGLLLPGGQMPGFPP